MATRKDSRGYSLKKGESQRKDGRYVFRYTTLRGEHRSVYAKELSELRKKEVKIRRAIEDGLDPDRAERITLNELFDEYISQKYDLKQSTMTNYKYMYNHYVRDGFGKLRISKIKYSDIKKFYYSLILEKGFKPNSMEIVHTLLHGVQSGQSILLPANAMGRSQVIEAIIAHNDNCTASDVALGSVFFYKICL